MAGPACLQETVFDVAEDEADCVLLIRQSRVAEDVEIGVVSPTAEAADAAVLRVPRVESVPSGCANVAGAEPRNGQAEEGAPGDSIRVFTSSLVDICLLSDITLAEVEMPDAVVSRVSTASSGKAYMWSLFVYFPPAFTLLLVALLMMLPALVLLFLMWMCARNRLCARVGVDQQSNRQPGFMQTFREPADARIEGAVSSEEGRRGRLPAQLQGVFYLRCNRFTNLVCFERGVWNACDSSLVLPLYSPRACTFLYDFTCVLLLTILPLIRYGYKFTFKADATGALTEASICVNVFGCTIPKAFIHFGMCDVSKNKDGSVWERWSTIMGRRFPNYCTVRVLDSLGCETSHMRQVEREVPATCLCYCE